MKLTALNADAAQIDPASGKVHALGIGAQTTTTPLPPLALIIIIDLEPSEEFGKSSSIRGMLHSADTGKPFLIDGERPFGFSTPAPTGGSDRAVLTLSFTGGITIDPGNYYWEVEITETPEKVRIPMQVLGPDIDETADASLEAGEDSQLSPR
ncbi:hypothetical protein [Nocardia rhizosphaerae]|uniref:Uncharacterized protein n=1 Tax=Nocardia rhizosphaerae TaxID=1691571 RepID=A0ABV8L274_9NOCA